MFRPAGGVGGRRSGSMVMAKMDLLRILFAGTMLVASSAFAHAEDGIDKAKADRLDAKVFGGNPGKKASACFVRRYDDDHLARHPRQKVGALLLLLAADVEEGETELSYSFRLGVKFRDRPGDFDSSGGCSHAVAEDKGHEIRFDCSVDCEGGGINVALAKDEKSLIVRLDQIGIWQRGKQGDQTPEELRAGVDDRVFRLDRADPGDCAVLVTDGKELASMSHE
jgi:hypothetical protein